MRVQCTAELGKQVVHDSSTVHTRTNHSATKMFETTAIHGGCVEENIHNMRYMETRKNTTDHSYTHKYAVLERQGCHLHILEHGTKTSNYTLAPPALVSADNLLDVGFDQIGCHLPT